MGYEYRAIAANDEKSWKSSSTCQASQIMELESNNPSDLETNDRFHSRRAEPVRSWIWLAHALLLLTSGTLFFSSICLRPGTLHHVQQFSAWSPAASAVEYEKVKFNITTTENRFVGAGPEVDKAWREISYDVGDLMILPHQLSKLDMPDDSLKVKDPKTGVEGYRVGMEAFHQLHCINLLRRVTYKEYYVPLGGEFAQGPEALRAHTDHCIEVLRLNIQCNADIGLFTLYMIPGDPLAWPQLNSWHQCRNFDQVRDWAMEHSVGNMEIS
ncbi:hypothetical protein MMC25_006193 [Agyrium rufum]|nr:hypothetical protein [Agyrium rufum]